MIITAHGGALKTGRNTKRYFDTISAYAVDAIEVDIRKRGKTLYLAHILPKLSMKRAIKMEWVLRYCVENNFKVNCDVKQNGLVKPLVELANQLGAGDHIYFTGSVTPEEIADLQAGAAYVNMSFYNKKYALTKENLPAIKRYLDRFNNPRLKGINVPFRYVSDEFAQKAKEIGLGLSIYTVDEKRVLARLVKLQPDNITTNIPDEALNLSERKVKK